MSRLRLEVEDASKNVLSTLVPEDVAIDSRLDEIGSVRVNVPASNPAAAYITTGKWVHLILEGVGSLGRFKVQEARVSVEEPAVLQVSGPDALIALSRLNTYLGLTFDNISLAAAVDTLLSGSLWTGVVRDPPPNNITAQFDGESLFNAILSLAQRFSLHLRADLTDQELTIGSFGDSSGLRVESPDLVRALDDNVLVVDQLERLEDAGDVVNRIIAVGAGEGMAQVSLELSDRASPYTVQNVSKNGRLQYYIEDGDSIVANGLVEQVIAWKDIRSITTSSTDQTNAANALYDAAVAYLAWYKNPFNAYRLATKTITPTLNVGDTLHVRWKGIVTRDGEPYCWLDIDEPFYVLRRRRTISSDGTELNVLDIADLPRRRVTDRDILIGTIRASELWKTRVQAYPSREGWNQQESIDSTHPVRVDVDISDEVLRLHHCLVRVQRRHLRVGATGASSGGAVTSYSAALSTAEGSGAHIHSQVAGSTANNLSEHTHSMGSHQGTSGWSTPTYKVPMELGGWGFDVGRNDSSGSGSLVTGGAGIHNHTGGSLQATGVASDHHHGIVPYQHTHLGGEHTHGLTWGIYESGGYPAGLQMWVDGVDKTSELGGPWSVDFQVEISDYFLGALQGLHYLEVKAGSGLGAVQVSVKLFTTVQTIAVA